MYLYKNRLVIIILKITDTLLTLLLFRKKKSPPQQCDKILIVKPDHLGDLLLFSSWLPSLRKNLPTSSIHLLCGRHTKELVPYLTEIDEIIWLDHIMHNRSKASWLKKLIIFFKDYLHAIKKIRANKYDGTLFMRAYGGNLISLSIFSGSGYCVGHGTAGGGLLLDHCSDWKVNVHETEHFYEVLSKLVNNLPRTTSPLNLLNRLEEPEKNLGNFDSYVVVQPTSGDPNRMFPVKFWREKLKRIHNDEIILCGLESDRTYLEAIQQWYPKSNLLTSLEFHELISLYATAQYVMTVESFGMHLCASTNTEAIIFVQPNANMNSWKPLCSRNKIYSVDPIQLTCSPFIYD